MKKKCKVCERVLFIYSIDDVGKKHDIHELSEGTYICHICRVKMEKMERLKMNAQHGKIGRKIK